MKIMCMGDSITYGTGLLNLEDRWSDIVAARTGHTLVNLGVPGDTTSGMLARCQTQVFAKEPDALLLLGGANDICFTYDYRQAFANILSMIRQAEIFEIPVVIGIPIPFVLDRLPNQEWFLNRDNAYITEQCAKLAQVLKAYCTAREVPYVDYRSAFLNTDGSVRTELYEDSLHPNADGHRTMSGVLCQRLCEIFPTT